ncbi:hypothetical protein PMZ80_003581 [Knufia obscura]|uniref:Phosphoinositide phospholipase C n=2 Tax=Knufia TaxID=430999 RepID=A0AAN8EMG4_9EURO|nr:hypothetical protein PMZ80_003581 [Knufia obscura]KAK5958503.1 hypothetical protein OHC33_000346 [Knufia fluminis]
MAVGQGDMEGQRGERVESSPSPLAGRAMKRMPSMQRVETTTNGALMVTPASANSASSITNSPSWSFQSSPYTFSYQQQYSLATVDSLNLPEPVIPSSMSSALSSSLPRQNGLTRTISSGKRALSRLGRTSSGTTNKRDPSSGPVARRRSDSKTSTVASFEANDPVPEIPHGLGLSHHIGSLDDISSINDNPARTEIRAEIEAPAVPDLLLGGVPLRKLTRLGWAPKKFLLDKDSGTVSWSGKLGNKKDFCIDNITSIRYGTDAASTWRDIAGPDVDPRRCCTITYAPSQSSKGNKSVHLIARTEHLCQLWVKTLEALGKHREEMMSEMTGAERVSALRAHWESELTKSISAAQGLDMPTVARLCRKLHIHCPRSVIQDAFHTADVQGSGLLDFEEFRAFVDRLRSRVDIKPLFNQLKTEGIDGISKADFLHFLQREQGIDVDSNYSHWAERFDQLAVRSKCCSPQYAYGQYIDFNAFSSFITSKDCHVYALNEKVPSTFNLPINEYFISTSHNTYLTGRQVNGTSSVEAYVTALRRGCRSVEIDCWNGENNNPRVTHGFTGTTSVPFDEVIKAINRCAFDVSSYPVILSLEVHCNPSQQLRMVEIMKKEIDSARMLLYPLLGHAHDLPSPEELRYKILIKVKATNAHPVLHTLGERVPVARQRSTSSPVRRPVPLHTTSSQQISAINGSPNPMSPPESIASPTDHSVTATSEDEYESDISGIVRTATDPVGPRRTSKITKELAALGVYMQGYSYRSPADLEFQKFNHIFSINENTALTVSKHQDSKVPFEKHNTSFMCRIYPRGTRLNSSNFDPNTFWRRGVQMVALNWQTYDIHMQMNQAMFAASNDRTGYVLKPPYLRDPARFGAAEQKVKLPHKRINFSVKIISAQQLPLLSIMGKNDHISPFVEVQMFSAEDKARGIAYGHGGEEVSRTNGYHGIGRPLSRRTKTVPENGYNPQFNDVFELSLETKYSELVFVRFVVCAATKNSHKELAVFTAKFDSLQRGYRHLPLYNSNGEELIFSTLFCHITKQEPLIYHRPEAAPSRHTSIRKILSRSNTTERGRTRGQAFADGEKLAAQMDRMAVQKHLNKEIEAKRR